MKLCFIKKGCFEKGWLVILGR